ncbi:hypothetical protein ACLOJK_006501 [Asimina triloba]
MSTSPDLEGLVVAIILLGADRQCAVVGEDRWTTAMIVIAGGGDGAPNSGALVVHELRCSYGRNFII